MLSLEVAVMGCLFIVIGFYIAYRLKGYIKEKQAEDEVDKEGE